MSENVRPHEETLSAWRVVLSPVSHTYVVVARTGHLTFATAKQVKRQYPWLTIHSASYETFRKHTGIEL